MSSASANAPTTEQIQQALDTIDRVRKAAQKNKEYGFDLPWDEFVLRMRCLTAQSYGSRFERYLIHKLGGRKIAAEESRGDTAIQDSLSRQDKYFEIKVSVVTASNTGVNFVQIRPHQNLDGYLLLVVDTTNGNTATLFQLTKQQMGAEVEQIGESAHGTKSAVENNATLEYAIRFPWKSDNKVRKRWEQEYKVPHQLHT